jgi:nondiscriminating glutamyl-tRNA synthetase
MVRVRFAPSPTGFLHIGGARTALFNLLFARKHQGTFILRVDDTDRERSLKENEENILSGLRCLGLNWDEGVDAPQEGAFGPYRQSERLERHLALAETLSNSGSAYTDDEGCVRLRYPENDIVFNDLISGECRFSPDALGPDPVILRSDGSPTYHLASVADDIEMKITHVIRGQDHLTNTAKHVVLFQAANAPLPEFAHLPLLLGEDGSKLSKRNSSGFTLVNDFIDAGYLPEALVNFMCLLGWSHPEGKDIFTIDEVAPLFSFDRVSHAGAKFELAKLGWYNGQYIRAMDPDTLASRTLPWTAEWRGAVEQRGMKWWTNAIYDLRTDFDILTRVKEIASYLLSESVELMDESKAHLAVPEHLEALRSVAARFTELLEEHIPDDGADCYSRDQIKTLIKLVKKSSSAPPKAVFQSLRILTTGALRGPELDVLMPYIPVPVLRSRFVMVLSQSTDL